MSASDVQRTQLSSLPPALGSEFISSTARYIFLHVFRSQNEAMISRTGVSQPESIIRSEAWKNVQDFSDLTGTEGNWVILG